MDPLRMRHPQTANSPWRTHAASMKRGPDEAILNACRLDSKSNLGIKWVPFLV